LTTKPDQLTHEHSIGIPKHNKISLIKDDTNKHTEENPRTNRHDRQKITFHGSAYPKEISQYCYI